MTEEHFEKMVLHAFALYCTFYKYRVLETEEIIKKVYERFSN